jgi:ParB family transcriptional regulator, chromosome partitioning protein
LPNIDIPQEMKGILDDIETSKIRLSSIQLRSHLYGIHELSKSVEQQGLLQPIIVRGKENYYEVVAGNRRYKACKSLGWRKIACYIVEVGDKEALEISLVENIQRDTLSPLEQANAFKKYVSDYGWGGVSSLALKMGKSISYITKKMKLLDLPSNILSSVTEGKLNISAAEELCFVKDKLKQTELAELVSRKHLPVSDLRVLIKDNGDDYWNSSLLCKEDLNLKKAEKIFDKSIITLRVAMIRLSTIIETSEDNWIVYNAVMEHKNMLHSQIDQLMREKRKVIKCDFES